jgi:hypothetical protein
MIEDAFPLKLDERFWSKVDRSGGPSACWPWIAGRHERGYGLYSPPRPAKTKRAHRLVLEEKLGRRLAAGEQARHAVCDNPPCCNPAHLEPGTYLDNIADRDRAGRQARGERVATAKLTEDAVRAIRAKLAAGRGPTALAREYRVRKFVIQEIRDGRAWRHVAAVELGVAG